MSDRPWAANSPRTSRAASLARNLLLSVASVVVFFALIEGILALVGYRLPDTQYFRRDPGLGFVLQPGTYPGGVRINADGFRGPDLVDPEPGMIRIVTLGDSCTFGVNLPEGETYARRLEGALAARGVRAQVVNAAVPGYTSLQGRMLLARVEGLRPAVVTVYFGWNDHWLGGFFTDRAMTSRPWLLALQGLAARSRVYHLMKQGLGARRPRLEQGMISIGGALRRFSHRIQRYRVPPDEYEENLRAIAEWGKRKGIHVIFITAPDAIPVDPRIDNLYATQGLIRPGDRLVTLHRAYNARVRTVAARTGAELVDAWSLFRDAGNNFFADPLRDPVHPNAAGHALLADTLAARIEDVPRRLSPEERRATRVDDTIRRGVDWYLRIGESLVCKKNWILAADPKYFWFMLRVAELTDDVALKSFLRRAIEACAAVDARFDIYRLLLGPSFKIPSTGFSSNERIVPQEGYFRWSVNCERWKYNERSVGTLFGTRYLLEHAGNRLDRKSYALTHMLVALVWLRQTEPRTGACVDPQVLGDRIHEMASRLAWEQYTGLDTLGGYGGTRRRGANGRVRYAMQDITGQRVGAILEAGYPGMVRSAWIDHLVASQNPDGGWSPNEGQPSSLHTTMCTLWALALARHTYPERFEFVEPFPRAASQ